MFSSIAKFFPSGTGGEMGVTSFVKKNVFDHRQIISLQLKKNSSLVNPKNILLDAESISSKNKYLRSYHTSINNWRKKGKDEFVKEIKPPVENFVIGDDVIPPERMTKMLSQINTDFSESFEMDENDIRDDPSELDLAVNEIVHVGRHTKVLSGGRLMSFSALVMVGTGKGVAGLGRARGETVAIAIQTATNLAQKNMICIERNRGCTISRDSTYKFKKTRVFVKACRTGYGIRASFQMRNILQAFGITDITMAMVRRTKNRPALYRAVFKGFDDEITTQEFLAKSMGKKMIDIKAFHYNDDD